MFFFNSGLNANYTLDDERWHKWLISIQGCILTVTVDGQVTLESKLTSFCQQTLFLREVIIDAGEFDSNSKFLIFTIFLTFIISLSAF